MSTGVKIDFFNICPRKRVNMATNKINYQMKQLCENILKEIGKEKCFYELEPLLCQRDENVTEDLLIYIFMNIRLPLNNLKQRVKQKFPDLDLTTIMETIISVSYGTIQIYPSELQRAGIPLPLYRFTTYFSSNKKYTIDSIIFFWKERFLSYEKIEYPTILLFDDILSLFFRFFFIKDFIVKRKVITLFQRKIPSYFDYLDFTLQTEYKKILDKIKIIESIISSDVASVIVIQSCSIDFTEYVHKTVYKAIEDMTNYITTYFDQEKKLDIYPFVNESIHKYFEYRMIKYNEKKLFGLFDYLDCCVK